MKGTLLNTVAVAVGATLGALAGSQIPEKYKSFLLAGIGLVAFGLGIKLFLQSKNIIIVAGAIVLGGAIGMALGIQEGIESFASWAQSITGGEGRFVEGMVTASVLFCVGPTTILGCLQDGLEKKIELLALKSLMDLASSIFLAASMGWGVLVSALIVLVVQGALTLSARKLALLASDVSMLAELSGTGGVLLMGIGLGLAEIKSLPNADFLPALFLAPIFVWFGRNFSMRKARQDHPETE